MAKKETQLTFQKTSGWGGKRRGAGRKNLSGTVNHMARAKVNLKTPLHVTLRLGDKMPNLRTRQLLKEFNVGMKKSRARGLSVIHFSLLPNHIHLIVEAENNLRLAAGMRSLAGRFAKIIRRRAHEKMEKPQAGPVFKGRYHLRVLKTPTEMKNALEYVLLNDSKHRDFIEHLDPFSSAKYFKGRKKLLGHRFAKIIKIEIEFIEKHKVFDEDFLSEPKSWLCRTGWERACG